MYNEDYRDYTDTTIDHMEQFAKEGFRTLVLAYRIISEEDYQVCESLILSFFFVEYIQICLLLQSWSEIYRKAATSIQNREKKIEEAAELIEKHLIILGATAIEDKLQSVSYKKKYFFIAPIKIEAKNLII